MDNTSTPCLECIIKIKEYSKTNLLLIQENQCLRSKIICTNNLILQYNTKCNENEILKQELRSAESYAEKNRVCLLEFLSKQQVVEKEIEYLKNEVQHYKTQYGNERDGKNECLNNVVQLMIIVEQQHSEIERKNYEITSVNNLLKSYRSALSGVKKKHVKVLRDAAFSVNYLIQNGGKDYALCRWVLERFLKELRSLDKTEYPVDEGIFSPDVPSSCSSKEGIFSPDTSNSLSRDVCFAEDLASVDSSIQSKEESVSGALYSQLITPERIKKPSLKKLKKPQSKSIFDIDEVHNSEILTESSDILKEKAFKPKRPLKCTSYKEHFLKSSSTISGNLVSPNKHSTADLFDLPYSSSDDILNPDLVKYNKVDINVMQTSTSSYDSLPLLTVQDRIGYENQVAWNRKQGIRNGSFDPKDGVIIAPEEQSVSLGPDLAACNSPANLDKESDIDWILRLVKNDLPLLSPLSAFSTNEEQQSSCHHEVKKVAVSTMTSLKLLDVGVGTEDFQFHSHAVVEKQESCSEEKKILTCSIAKSEHPKVQSVGIGTKNNCLSLSHRVCKDVCVVRTKNFASASENMRPVRMSKNASQTENVRLRKSCENASQTENMKPVKSRDIATQTEKMESVTANALPLQHAPVACICNLCEIHGSSSYRNRVVVNINVSNVEDHQVSTKDSIAEEQSKILSHYLKYKNSIQEQLKTIDNIILRILDIANKEKASENLRSSECMLEVVATTSKNKVSNDCEIVHILQEKENGKREQKVQLVENESGRRESNNMPKKSTWNNTKPDRNPFYRKPQKNVHIYHDTENALFRLPSQEWSQSLPLVSSNTHLHSYKDIKAALSNPSFHSYSPVTPKQPENKDQLKTPSKNTTESQISSNSVNSSDSSASTQVSCVKSSYNNDIKGTGEQDSNLKYPIVHQKNKEISAENSECYVHMWQLGNEDSSDLVGNECHKSTETKTPIPEGDISSKVEPTQAELVNTSLTHVDLFGSESDSDSSSKNCVNLNKRKIDVRCYNQTSEVTKRQRIGIFDEESNDRTSACSMEVSQQNSIPETVQQQTVQLLKNKRNGPYCVARKLSKLQKMKRDFIKANLPSKIPTDILDKSPKQKCTSRSNKRQSSENNTRQTTDFLVPQRTANKQNLASPPYTLRERRTNSSSHDSQCTTCTNGPRPSTSPHSVQGVLNISSPPRHTSRRKSINTTSDCYCSPSQNVSTRYISSDQHSTRKRKVNSSDMYGSNSSSPAICGRVTRSGVHLMAGVKIEKKNNNTIHPGGIIQNTLYNHNFEKLQLNNKFKGKLLNIKIYP